MNISRIREKQMISYTKMSPYYDLIMTAGYYNYDLVVKKN